MEYSSIQDVLVRGLYLNIIITLAIVIPGMIVGLLISIIQAATQINEASVNFVPKLMVTFFCLTISSGWIFNQINDFYRSIVLNLHILLE